MNEPDYNEKYSPLLAWLKEKWDYWFGNRTFGASRSSQWSSVRNTFAKAHPLCEVCGSKSIEIHHISPFHLHPELELDPTNFISLCRPHHYLFGHFMNWSSFNKDVVGDSKSWQERIKSRP